MLEVAPSTRDMTVKNGRVDAWWWQAARGTSKVQTGRVTCGRHIKRENGKGGCLVLVATTRPRKSKNDKVDVGSCGSRCRLKRHNNEE